MAIKLPQPITVKPIVEPYPPLLPPSRGIEPPPPEEVAQLPLTPPLDMGAPVAMPIISDEELQVEAIRILTAPPSDQFKGIDTPQYQAVDALMHSLYPEKYGGLVQPGIDIGAGMVQPNVTAQTLRDTLTQAQDDSQTFIRDLYAKGWNPNTERLLRLMGADEAAVTQIFAGVTAEVQQQKLMGLVNSVWTKGQFGDLEDFIDFAEKRPDLVIRQMQTGPVIPQKGELLRNLGYSWDDIGRILSVIRTQAPVNGIQTQVAWDTTTNRAYDNNNKWVGTFNPVTNEFAAMPDEWWLKDGLDAVRMGMAGAGLGVRQFVNIVLPNAIWRDVQPARGRNAEEQANMDAWAAGVNKNNKQLRDKFRAIYGRQHNEYEEWVTKHPDLQSQGWLTGFIESVPLMLAAIGTTATGVALGQPGLGVLGGLAVMTPVVSSDVYNDLLTAGATEAEAANLAVVVGGLISATEVIAKIPYLKNVTPSVLALFRKKASQEVAEAVVGSIARGAAKTGIRTGLQITGTESLEEMVQQAMQNAAVKFYDENRSLLEGVAQAGLGAAVLTAPLAIFGGVAGAVSTMRVAPSRLVGLTDVEMKNKGWVEDPKTPGNWYEAIKQMGREFVTSEAGGIQIGPKGQPEIWQMTRNELIAEYRRTGNQQALTNISAIHQAAIKEAATAGKPISAEVLKDYPDLAKTIKAAPVKAPVAPESAAVKGAVKVELVPVRSDSPEVAGSIYKGEEVVGWFAGRTTEDSLRIAALNIQKQGVGNRQFFQDFMDSVEKTARAKGLRFVEAVDPKNIAVYKTMGFKEVEKGVLRKAVEPAVPAGKAKVTPEPVAGAVVPPAAPPAQAEVSGQPPSPTPPQSVVAPIPPTQPGIQPAEVKRIITQSMEQVRQDVVGALTRAALKIPGIKQLMEFERPGLKMTGENQKVLVAMVAENAARSDVATRALATRLDLLKDIRKTFGKDALRGGQVEGVKFVGTEEQRQSILTGTVKDIADNPELYELSRSQKNLLVKMESRNNELLAWVTEKYGAEIGQFKPKPGGAFLPNVDIGEDVIEYLGSETRAAASGRGKTRIWPTARDRMVGKTKFTPQLDVQKLIEGLDSFKSSAAGGQTFRAALEGKTRLEAMETTHPDLFQKMMALRKKLISLQGSIGTIEANINQAIADFMASANEDVDLANLRDSLEVKLQTGIRAGMDIPALQAEMDAVRADIAELRPAWKAANLKPFVFVQEGVFRYFPAEQAKLISESRKVTNNPLLNFIERWRGQTFSGDFSPFAIQGTIGVLADPFGSLKAGVGAAQMAMEKHDLLRSFKVEALADDIANNLTEWSEYASLMGRTLSGTPVEYAAGFLSKIPRFDKFTESTYITVTRASFNNWQRNYEKMVDHGIPVLEAKVAAARIASEIYPLVDTVKLGQSQARASVLRALPTSYSFIRQPASLIAEAVKGYAKLATLQKLNPSESLSVKVITTMAASVLITSATSAAIAAMQRDEDDDGIWKAIWDAINPNPYNGKFATIIIGKKRILLGGPYRSIFRAIYPQEVKGVPFPVPFAGLPRFLRNRITPALATQLDLLLNKDYSKTQIIKGQFPENVLRFLEYEFENFLPLTGGTVAERIRQGERYNETLWQQVIAQFVGVNLVTLDNTYLHRQIRKLGLPQGTITNPLSINKPDIYTTKDLWADARRVLGLRTGDKTGYDDPAIVRDIIEVGVIKDEMDSILNVRPIDINENPDKGDTFIEYYAQWQERQTLLKDEKALAAFDKQYPNAFKGNFAQDTLVLLKQYHSLTDAAEKKKFLKDHPDLSLDPRDEWLKANPDKNARLGIYGQAKMMTEEAVSQAQARVKALGIPQGGLPDMSLPPVNSVKNYGQYVDVSDKFGPNSPEAKLLVANDEELRKFLGREPIETPVAALELKVKWREQDTEYDALKTDAERLAYLAQNEEYRKDRRRREAYEKGLPSEMVETYVSYYEMPEKGYRRERFLLENPDLAKALNLQLPERVPAVQYDDITDQYRDQFDELEGNATFGSPYYIEDPVARAVADDALKFTTTTKTYFGKTFTAKALTEFGEAYYRRQAYAEFVPDNYIEDALGWKRLGAEGKPTDWKAKTGTDYWYEDDWYMMEHQPFYKEVYIAQQHHDRLDFTKVPSRPVFQKYLGYVAMPDSGTGSLTAKRDYRRAHPDLDWWMVNALGYAPLKTGGTTTSSGTGGVGAPIIP